MRTRADVTSHLSSPKVLSSALAQHHGSSFFGELVKGFSNIGEVWDEPSVEVDKADKGLNFGYVLWGWPLFNTCNFDWVHLDVTL